MLNARAMMNSMMYMPMCMCMFRRAEKSGATLQRMA